MYQLEAKKLNLFVGGTWVWGAFLVAKVNIKVKSYLPAPVASVYTCVCLFIEHLNGISLIITS